MTLLPHGFHEERFPLSALLVFLCLKLFYLCGDRVNFLMGNCEQNDEACLAKSAILDLGPSCWNLGTCGARAQVWSCRPRWVSVLISRIRFAGAFGSWAKPQPSTWHWSLVKSIFWLLLCLFFNWLRTWMRNALPEIPRMLFPLPRSLRSIST